MTKIKHIRRLLSFCLTVYMLNYRRIKVDSSSLSESTSNGLQNGEDTSGASQTPFSQEPVLGFQDFNPANNPERKDMTRLNKKNEKAVMRSPDSINDFTIFGMESDLFNLLPDFQNETLSSISEIPPSTSKITSEVKVGESSTLFTTPKTGTEVIIKRDKDLDIINQEELRSKIIENLPIVCPTGRVCRQTSLEDIYPGYAHCCKECSCETGCDSANQTCCFESDALENQSDFERECYFLTTANIEYSQRHRFISYDMISKCSGPSGGGISKDIPCGEENTAPWGSLYPVYSKSTGKIFKNSACALCNGVSDGEALDVMMICQVYASDDRMQNIANFESFLNGFNPDNLCYVNFKPHVPFSALDHLRCLQEPISDCSNENFDIPDGVSMSKGEIIQACSSSLTSYYTMLGPFKNVFCHICNNKKWDEVRICYPLLHYPRGDLLITFSTLLSKDFLLQTYKEKRLKKQLPLACMVTKSFKKICRRIFCPDGMTYDGRGNCIYPASRWDIDAYQLLLRLLPETIIENKYIKEIESFDASILISPLPNIWILQTLSYRTKSDNSDIVDHFIATVRVYSLPKVPSFVLAAAKRFMKRRWFLLINETRIGLTAEFSGMREFDTENKIVKPRFFRTLNNSDNSYNFGWILLRDIFALLPRQSLLTLTQMFYCYQIALQKGEYVLEHEGYILRYNDTYFLDGEFSYVIDTETEEYIPRVCIENSGFSRQHLNRMNAHRPEKCLVFAFAIFVCHALVLTE